MIAALSLKIDSLVVAVITHSALREIFCTRTTWKSADFFKAFPRESVKPA